MLVLCKIVSWYLSFTACVSCGPVAVVLMPIIQIQLCFDVRTYPFGATQLSRDKRVHKKVLKVELSDF